MAAESKYTYEQKLQVCNWYVVEGSNSIRAAKRSGIPAQTIRHWTKTQWWADMVLEVRKHHQDRLDGRFTYVIDQLYEELLDRVREGDEVYDSKRGKMVRRAMSGRDLSQVMNQVIEKRALLRGDPTSRTANVSTEKKLADLQSRLEKRTREQRQIEESDNVSSIEKQTATKG